MKWTWTVILGFAVLATAEVATAQPQTTAYVSTTASDSLAFESMATSDSLAFASVSRRVRLDSMLRVYRTTTPESPLALRGIDLLPTGIRLPPAENSGQAGRNLSWAEVREVQVRRGAGTSGAIAGGVLFGLAGAGLMFGIAHDEFLNSGNAIGAGEVIGAAFLSAIPGALLGAAVGSLIHKWKTVPIAGR